MSFECLFLETSPEDLVFDNGVCGVPAGLDSSKMLDFPEDELVLEAGDVEVDECRFGVRIKEGLGALSTVACLPVLADGLPFETTSLSLSESTWNGSLVRYMFIVVGTIVKGVLNQLDSLCGTILVLGIRCIIRGTHRTTSPYKVSCRIDPATP